MLMIRPEDLRPLSLDLELVTLNHELCEDDGCYCQWAEPDQPSPFASPIGWHAVVYGRRDGERYTSNRYYRL